MRFHVEGHSAALMRFLGLKRATLYINRFPCRYQVGPGRCEGCDVLLPKMLPKGAQLTVIVREGPGQPATKLVYQGE